MEARKSQSWQDSKLRKFIQEPTDSALVAEVEDAIGKVDTTLLSTAEAEAGVEPTNPSWKYWADGQEMRKQLFL